MDRQRRIMVTGAGAGPAVAVIKALRRRPAGADWVLAVDMSPHAAGLYLADERAQVPAAGDSGFVPRLLDLCSRRRIEMVIPILDGETMRLAEAAGEFAAAGVHLACNSLACAKRAADKGLAYQLCEQHGIAQPARFSSPQDAPRDAFPLIGKPRRGVGGRGQVVLEDAAASVARSVDVSDYLWQRFIAGREFSVDTFGDPDGMFAAVPRHRRVVKAGQMVQGETVNHPGVRDFARRACAAFGARDVCCVQIIEAAGGELHFIELNARYGTGVSLSIAAGVDFPRLQWLRLTDPERITPAMLQFQPGKEMIRYWEEIYP